MPTLERRSLMEPDEVLRLQNQFYDVFEVEDFEYTETEFTRVAGANPPAPILAGVQTQPFNLDNLEPDVLKQKMLADFSGVSRPPMRAYQVLMGINVDNVWGYLEVMAGHSRMGVAQAPVPLAANRRVGRFDFRTSPPEDPKLEFWVQTGQVPAVFLFNNNGYAVANALLECVGRKYTLLEKTQESDPEFFARFLAGKPVTYRRVSQFGLDDEFNTSPRIANQ